MTPPKRQRTRTEKPAATAGRSKPRTSAAALEALVRDQLSKAVDFGDIVTTMPGVTLWAEFVEACRREECRHNDKIDQDLKLLEAARIRLNRDLPPALQQAYTHYDDGRTTELMIETDAAFALGLELGRRMAGVR